MRVFLILILCLSSLGTTYGDVVEDRCHFGKCHVSILHLASSPDDFDSKAIIVKGVLSIEEREVYIYFDEASAKNKIRENSVVVEFNLEADARVKLLSGEYALVEGVFDKSKRGSSNLALGGITKVTRIHPATNQ